MTFTAKDVADLRQKTGAGMMECKNALKEANGNVEKASEILRQKGLVAAAKKSERTALEGIVASKNSDDKKSGVILEINAQTDFVAKNDLFIDLSKKILNILLKDRPGSIDDLLKIKIDGTLISDLISSRIATVGENIQPRRFEIFELSQEEGAISSYIHPVGNKIGVLVKLVTNSKSSNIAELEQLARDIAMHIAAAQPQAEYIDKTKIPQEIIENEKRIELGKEDLVKKPKEIAEKIVQGRLDKLLSQRCLLDQPYIKDQNITVEKLIKDKSKQLNVEIKVKQFIRYNVGEALGKTSEQEEKTTVSVS